MKMQTSRRGSLFVSGGLGLALSVASIVGAAPPETVSSPASVIPQKPVVATPATPTPATSTPAPVITTPPATAAAPVDPLLAQVEEAIKVTSRRYLDGNTHTPWQMVHGLLALRENFEIKIDGIFL